MSAGLRAASRGFGRRLAGEVQHQQRRAAGDLPVKPNKYIEDHGYHMENVERDFRWSGRTLTNIAIFAVLVPYAIFRVRCVPTWPVTEATSHTSLGTGPAQTQSLSGSRWVHMCNSSPGTASTRCLHAA